MGRRSEDVMLAQDFVDRRSAVIRLSAIARLAKAKQDIEAGMVAQALHYHQGGELAAGR